jgi:homoaconitate hydratase
MAQNLIEKIVQRFAVDWQKDREVHSGEYLFIRPAHVLTHDNTGAVMPKFKSIGAKKIANPRQPVFALDHDIQNQSEKNREKYRSIESFAKEMGVDFYPAGRGIGHQIICEEGYAWPGTMVVASDSHANMYGGLGCLGTPIVRTDAAAIWATGKTWWQVPPVARVELTGKLSRGATGKDVIVTLCGFFNKDEVLNHVVEFVGDGINGLTIEERLTIANMTTEWGALAGVFPADGKTLDWLRKRADYIARRGLEGVASDQDAKGNVHPRVNRNRIDELEKNMPEADTGAEYAKELLLDLSSVQPHVSGPNTVKNMNSVGAMSKERVKIQKAYLVSCVNSRLDDIAAAAKALDGKKVADGVEFYVAAASSEVQSESEKTGAWQALLDAGAKPLPAGCGPCIGLGAGLLEDGEVGISATNRNFKGRMGSREADVYLASPEVVAASAVAGYITAPGHCSEMKVRGEVLAAKPKKKSIVKVEIREGFPSKITGELLFCHQDNLNTDGIFPGKYTYQDDFTSKQQAEVVMENYDPEFKKVAQKGDILAGGFNFGSGSSREQAATALKYRGIRCVIAGSFSETYRRNALNNGFLVIEAPDLIEALKDKIGTEKLTVRTGITGEIDVIESVLRADGKEYPIGPIGTAAQDLILAGGLESMVKKSL